MGMPIEEAPSALHAGDSSGDRRARPGCGLEEVPDRLVGQAGQCYFLTPPYRTDPDASRPLARPRPQSACRGVPVAVRSATGRAA